MDFSAAMGRTTLQKVYDKLFWLEHIQLIIGLLHFPALLQNQWLFVGIFIVYDHFSYRTACIRLTLTNRESTGDAVFLSVKWKAKWWEKCSFNLH